MANIYVAPCGRVFDLDALVDGQPAPSGTTSMQGHTSVFWPDQGHLSWNNPGQTDAHWSTHSEGGTKAGRKPPGATFRGE